MGYGRHGPGRIRVSCRHEAIGAGRCGGHSVRGVDGAGCSTDQWGGMGSSADPRRACWAAAVSTRSVVLGRVALEIRSVLGAGVTRVAIDGLDGAGKTCFANELASCFSDVEVIRASIDGFHHPRAVRYSRGEDSPEGFFLDSFNYPLLKSYLLDPLSTGGSGRYRVAAFDHRTDRAVDSPLLTANPPSILVFDGIFSHRPDVVHYWDYSIFLAVDRRESLRRCNQRDAVRHAVDDPRAAVHRRYTKGQDIYLRSCKPQAAASIVINNDDLAAPYVVARQQHAPMLAVGARGEREGS
jgi:uridine kinase